MDTIRFKPVTTIRIVGILLVLLLGVFSLAQDIGLTGPAGTEISICGDGEFTVTITNVSTDITNLDVSVAVVSGVGSATPVTGEFSLVYNAGVTPTDNPDSYSIDPVEVNWEDRTIATGGTWEASLRVSPQCDAFSNRRLVVNVSYDYYDGGDLVHVTEPAVYSDPIQVLTPNLYIELNPDIAYGAVPGSTVSWEVYGSNTGAGVLSNGMLTIELPTGDEAGGLLNLSFDPAGSAPPIGGIDTELLEDIPIADLTGSAAPTLLGVAYADLSVGDQDDSCKNLYVTFTGAHGCESGPNPGDDDCQDPIVVTGSVNLEYRTPNLDYSFNPAIIETIPYCEESEPVTVTITNAGDTAGNIVGLTMQADAYGVSYTVTGDTFPDINVVAVGDTFVFENATDPLLPSVIGPNADYTFTFTAHREDCAAVDCNSLVFTPSFRDDCGDIFEPPIKELPIHYPAPGVGYYTLNIGAPADIPDEGETLAYTITATYHPAAGETEEARANVSVTLPDLFILDSGGTSAGYDLSGNTVTWDGPTSTGELFRSDNAVPWTVAKTLSLEAHYPADLDCGDGYSLESEVVPTTGMCGGLCPPPGATASYGLFGDTMLGITKSVAGGDNVVYVGEPLDFTITVSYYGPRVTIGSVVTTPPAVLTDTLPAGFRLAATPAVTPPPTTATGGLLTWCLSTGTLSQTTPLTFTYTLEPIPYDPLDLGNGYDPCLCGTTVTNTATVFFNADGGAGYPTVPAECSPFGTTFTCFRTAVLSFAYNCEYGAGGIGFEVVKEVSPDGTAARCRYEDGITFTNRLTFNQAYSWNTINFTDRGNEIGMAFGAGPDLTGTASFTLSGGSAVDHTITLGTALNLGDVFGSGGPAAGDELEITYTLYFTDAAVTGNTAVNWSDFLFPETVTECEDDDGEAHAGAWVTPVSPSPSITISDYCHYTDEDVCTFVINRCDTAQFRVYLSSTRNEYGVTVTVDLWGGGANSNYTFNNDAGYEVEFVNMRRPDGSEVSAFAPTVTGGGRFLTWDLGDLGPMGTGRYIKFFLDTACSGGTDTTATVSTSGWCGEDTYSDSMAYRASRNQLKANLLVKKTPDVIYTKDRNEDLNWTVYVTNPTSAPATEIRITDTLGAGVSYVDGSLAVTMDGAPVTPGSVVVTPGVYAPGTPTAITFDIPDLAPGKTAVITLTGHVESCEERTNKTDAVWGCYDEITGFDYCGEGHSEVVTVDDYGTRVVISRHEADDINLCGGTSYVEVTFRNIGKAYAYNMVLTETLPTGLEYDDSGGAGGWTVLVTPSTGSPYYLPVGDVAFSPAGSSLTWTFSSTVSMKPVDGTGNGDQFTVRFPVRLDESVTECQYTDGTGMTATLSYNTPCAPADSDAKDTVSTVSAPVLVVDKSPDNVAGDPSDPIVWTIDIENPSYYTAEAVFLWDLPPDFIFTPVTIIGGDYIPSSGRGTEDDPWVLNDIAPHGSVSFQVQGTLRDCSGGGSGENTATVQWCDKCEDSASSNVSNIYNIPNVALSVDTDIDYCGGTITVTLVNSGSRAYDVVLTDEYPEGFAYVTGTATISSNLPARTFVNEPDYGGALPANTLRWDSDNIGYIEKFETLTITFILDNEVNVESPSPGDELCTTTFGPSNSVNLLYHDGCFPGTPDYVSSEVTDVSGLLAIPVLSVTKELDPDSVVIGETEPAVWHITVGNSGGPADGTITIVDTFGTGWDMTTVNAPLTINGTGTRTINVGARTVTWTGVSLGTGASVSFDIEVAPLSTGPEADLTNRIDMSGDCLGGCQYGSAQDATNPIPGHTEITKRYTDTTPARNDIASATIGETVHVIIRADYYGSTTLYSNVTIDDTPPVGLSVGTPVLTYGGACGAPTLTGPMTWSVPNFTGYGWVQIDYDAVVRDIPANVAGVTLQNTAGTDYTTGGTGYHDEATDSIVVIEPQLELVKTEDVPANPSTGENIVVAGQVVHYYLYVRHIAGATNDATANDIVVTDSIPVGLTVDETTITGGATRVLSGDGRTITWTINPLAVGAGTVTLTYNATVDSGATGVIPRQSLLNTATMVWSTMVGDETIWPEERDYSATATNTLTVQYNSSISKLPDGTPLREFTIGSVVTYQINVTLPRANIPTLVISDIIGGTTADTTGLRFESATFGLNNGATPYTPPAPVITGSTNGTGRETVTWTISDFPGYLGTTSRVLRIDVTCVVTNVAENQDGDQITNRATYALTAGAYTASGSNSAADILIREPFLTVDKSHALVSGTAYEAGSVVRYTLRVTNTGNYTAYDSDVRDTIPYEFTGVTYVSGDAAGNISHNFSGNPLIWRIESLAAGASVDLVYDITIGGGAVVGTDYQNDVEIWWQSLDAAADTYGERRDGSDGTGGLNDYYNSDYDIITIDESADITKTCDRTSATIGETLTYTITVDLPRAVVPALTVTDVLDARYGYVSGNTTITLPDGTVISGASADPSSMSPITWDFTNIAPDASFTDDDLVIVFEAVVLNDMGNQDTAADLTNESTASGASLVFVGTGTDTKTVFAPEVDIIEPVLTITKSVASITDSDPGTNPDIVAAGSVVEYSLVVENIGTSTAFDVRIEDTLPAGLINPANLTGGDSRDNSGNPIWWEIDSIPMGGSVTLTYEATVASTDDVSICTPLTNSVVGTWTSLHDATAGEHPERREGLGTALDDYVYTTTYSLDVNNDASIAKTWTPSPDGYWTIGSEVNYVISITLPKALIPSLTVTEYMGDGSAFGSGLRFVSAEFVAPGDAASGGISPASETILTANDGSTQTQVEWTFSDIPGYEATSANRDLIIIVTAVVTNIEGNNDGDTIPNYVTASGTCLDWQGAGGNRADSADIVVQEPHLVISKRVVEVHAPGIVEAGAVIEYELTVTNDSAIPAYNIAVTDTLDAGMTNPTDLTGGDSRSVTGNVITWGITALDDGGSVTLGYHVTVDDTGDVEACADLTNRAVVTWTSLPLTPTEERTGSETPAWNDYTEDVTLDVPVNSDATITKTLTSDPTVTIGSTATYDIHVTLPKAGIPSLTLTETIGGAGIAANGLEFVGATFEAPGGGVGSIAPDSQTVSPPNDGTAQVTVTWVFTDIPGYNATDTDRDMVIHVTARVTDVPENKDLDVIPNSVATSNTCLTVTGSPTPDVSVTVRVPALTIEKSVTAIVGADGVPRATVEPGGIVTYTITVNNVGSGEARDVILSDTLLPEFTNPTHVSGGDSHDFSGNPLTWTINSIPGYGSATVVFTVTATSAITEGTVYINCASVVGEDILGNAIPADNTDHVSADLYDAATGTDRSCAPVTGAVPTLFLDKEILSVNGVPYTSDMTVQPGDYIVFRVTVSNNGTGTAYDVNLTDTLSEGLGYGDYLAPPGDIPPTLGTGTYTSAAWSDYYDAAGTPVGSLTAHTHGNAPEDTGGTVPATIGTLIWDGSDIRPLSLPTSSPNPSVTGIVLPGGQSYVIEYVAYVNGLIIQHSIAENLADAEARDGYGTTVPCNDDRTSINTREPFFVTDKSITQIDGDPANTLVAVVGSIIDYSYTITNVGEGDAHDVNIFDTLPVGFRYVPGSANIGDPEAPFDGNSLTWLVNANILSGETYTVTFQVEVTDGTSGGTQINTAWVEGLDLSDQPVTKDGSSITALDTDEDDLDDVPVEVDIPNVPIILTKEVTPRSVTAGAVVRYTVTFTNNRKISFYDATITDTMPHGFTYKPGTALLNGVLIADPTGNNPYVFSIGTVGPESVTRLDYYVLVSQAARHGANVNWAVLNAHDGAGKPITLRDRATVTVTDDSFFDFEKFPFLPRFTRPAAAPERPRVPERERPRPECCLVVTAIPVRSQDFGDTVPGQPEIYYQTDIAMYAATELLVTERRLTPWLEVQGFDPERTYLMTGLYNRMITKLGEYAQYNLGNVVMESLLGIPLEYAPGILEKARREGTTPERAGTGLTRDLAKRAGLSEAPDIQPIFLEYFGSYPYLHERIAEDKLAWEETLMDKNIMPAALGFTLLREANQIETFLASDDPTERFFGLLLLTQAIEKTRAISTDLAKTAEFSPPVRYLPHFSRIEIEKGRGLTWRTTDETSTLYDHASVLWGLSKLRSVALHSSDSDVRALVPQVTERMNEVYHAIEAIHYDEQNKGFVSIHAPGEDPGVKSVTAKDLAFTILAMRSVLFDNRDLTLNSVAPKRTIVEIADFMIEELMDEDGGVYTAFNYADGTPVVGEKRTLVDNALAVRALLSAYVVTEDRKYRTAALKVYGFMLDELWYEDLMIFIDEEDPDYEVVLTPQSIGALIGALRDLVLYGDPKMRHDYLDRMSYTTDRVLDQSQLQLYENRFFPWHAPITIIPKDPNGRSYIKPIVTTLRDKGISHDLAPILVRKMVLNITPTGAIASGNEDAVSDWNKWKANLRYEVPDIIASAVVDDTFVTDEGMYFTTLTRDYQQNLHADLPAFNPYHTDPGMQVYGAFVGGEVSTYNVKNLTLNSGMGIGLSESELVRRLAKKAGKSPGKYLTDFVEARAPKDAAGDDILSRFLNRLKGVVGLAAGGRFPDIIYLEYVSAKPFYTEGISDGWDEKTFDKNLTVSSMSSTMVRQLMFILDNSGRTGMSQSDRFVNDVITMSVAAKRVVLGEIIRNAQKDGIAGVPHSFTMVPDDKEKRSAVKIAEKKSTLFDDTFAIWAVALYIDAKQKGLFSGYRTVMTDAADDEAVLAALIDALIAHHYSAEYGTLVTGSVNTVDVSKALDMLTRAAEVMDDGPAKEKLTGLIRKQADFIMTRLATDTGFEPMIGLGGEQIPADLCEFETLGTNVFPILALVRTWEVTGDEKYLNRALVYFDRFDESKWDQEIGLYLSSGTIYKATDRERLELEYDNQELIAAVLLISKLQPHLSGERKVLSAYHMTTFMNRIMEIASVERYPGNEGSADTIYSPQIIRSVKIILSESKGVGKPGDVFTNRIVIDNDCYDGISRPLARIRIEQTLPEGFHYVPGSTRFNGAAGPDPIGRKTLNWYYPLLSGRNRLVIDYQVVADPNIKEGAYTASLDVMGFSGYGGDYVLCEDRDIAATTLIVADPFAGDMEKSCVPCDIGRRALSR